MKGVDVLAPGLSAMGLAVDAVVLERLERYVGLIVKWNQVYNLTAIRDRERMLVEHVLDSLSIHVHVRPSRILDVGSGAGLPGVPLAIIHQGWDVTLLDSSQKRCAFLRQAVIELRLENVHVACERIETYRPSAPFDTVVSRAFAGTRHFARLAAPLLGDDGVILAMKGLYPHEELAELPSQVVLKHVLPVQVPGLAAQRHLVVMTRA